MMACRAITPTVTLLFSLWLCATAYAQLGPTLTVGTILQRPYLFTEGVDDNNETVYKGFIKDIMDHFTAMAGFSYDFAVRPDSHFGYLMPNGSWGGLIGDLVQGQVDIAAASLTETSARHRVVSFSTWFQRSGLVVIMRRPDPDQGYAHISLATRLNRLFDPLSESVWLLSIVGWLVTSIVLYFISYVNPYDWRRMCRDREATLREGESFTCLNSFWFTLSAVFWQGYLRCPRSIGARIVVLGWWLYSLIFVSMYIASLTNFLQSGPLKKAEDPVSIDVDSIADLAEQDKISYGVLDKGSTLAFFRSAQKTPYKKMWARMSTASPSVFVPSLEAGVERVRSSRKRPFALITESAMAKIYVNDQSCDLFMVDDVSTTGSYSFATRVDNTTLGAILDLSLLTLRETGQLQQMEDKWFPKDNCPKAPKKAKRDPNANAPYFHKVDLASFSGALILLVISLVSGAIVTGLEICIYKYAEVGERPDRKTEKRSMNDRNTVAKDSSMHSAEAEPMTDV